MNTADMQGAVAEEVNSRLTQATRELEAKYAAGAGGQDETSVDVPTGPAYQEKYKKEIKIKQEKKLSKQNAQYEDLEESGKEVDMDEEDENNDNGKNDDEDFELRLIREQRLKQIKKMQSEKLENISKGHGEFREVDQDSFIKEVTSSDKVICLFYHRDFPRCTVMDHHLKKLSAIHFESKFIKVNAEKTLFFVEKLVVRSMPTVVIFHDGVAIDKIIGFEGLIDNLSEGHEDEWSTIRLANLLATKGAIKRENIIDEDGKAVEMKEKMEAMRKHIYLSNLNADMDDDMDLDD